MVAFSLFIVALNLIFICNPKIERLITKSLTLWTFIQSISTIVTIVISYYFSSYCKRFLWDVLRYGMDALEDHSNSLNVKSSFSCANLNYHKFLDNSYCIYKWYLLWIIVHYPGTPPGLKPVNQGALTIQGLHLTMLSFRKVSFFTDKKEIQRSATALGYVAHVSFTTSLTLFASDLICWWLIFYLVLLMIHSNNHVTHSFSIVTFLISNFCSSVPTVVFLIIAHVGLLT